MEFLNKSNKNAMMGITIMYLVAGFIAWLLYIPLVNWLSTKVD
jgi:hypothetical protein